MVRSLWLVAFLAVSLPSVFAQTRMIPHVTRAGGGFTSEIIIENLGSVDQTVTLNPFSADGAALTAREITVSPLGVIRTTAETLFEGEAVSHFEINADEGAQVKLAYNFSGSGSPAHVDESNQQASRWRLFPGNWEQIFDGIAVVNRGDIASDIWIAQKDLDGNVIQTVQVAEQLAPNAKALYVIGSPTETTFTANDDSYFEVSADQPLAITALRGSLPGSPVSLLWANETRAMSLSKSKRDSKKVWFIEDGSIFDVHEMMGYNTASDRLWQSELHKRTATGRMSELFGQQTFDSDLVVRQTGYSDTELQQEWDKMDEVSRDIVLGYVHGFNRRIGEVNNNLEIMPFEFKALGINKVEAWTHFDVLDILNVVQRDFSLNNLGLNQAENLSLAGSLIEIADGDIQTASRWFEDLRPVIDDPGTPTMIPRTGQVAKRLSEPENWENANIPGKEYRQAISEFKAKLENNKEVLRKLGAEVKMGSYAWVVSGDKTASGNPILFAGPQVGFASPSPVLEGSIVSDDLTVSGMTIAGVPAMIVGRTPHHAWSFQVGHAHSADFYFEDPAGVFIDRTEVIRVAGSGDVNVSIVKSFHGPVLVQNPILSWKYAHKGFEFNLSGGILKLATAKSIDEFEEGVNNLGISQHILYADVKGNIAYWMSGRDPVRAEGNWRFPQGFLPPLEWDANVIKPLPHSRNHERGWYGGWNNQASENSVDITATHFFGPFHRAHMVDDFFAGKENLAFEEIRDLAFDLATTFNSMGGGYEWIAVKDYFEAAIDEFPTDERREALDMINSWHGHFPAGEGDEWLTTPDTNDAWMLQRQWIQWVLDNTFVDELGRPQDGEEVRFRYFTLIRALNQDDGVDMFKDWFLNDDPEKPQNKNEIIANALDFAIEFSNDVFGVPWGKNGRDVYLYDHALLGRLYDTPFFNSATYAQCVEMGANGPVRIDSTFSIGQAATVLSDPVTGQPITEFGTTLPLNVAPPSQDPFFGMSEYYDVFTYRSFPLFESGNQ